MDIKPMTPLKYNDNRMRNIAKLATIMTEVSRTYLGRELTSQERDQISLMAEEIAFRLPEDVEISGVHKMDAETILRYINSKARIPANPTISQRISWWWKNTTLEERLRIIVTWILLLGGGGLMAYAYWEVLL